MMRNYSALGKDRKGTAQARMCNVTWWRQTQLDWGKMQERLRKNDRAYDRNSAIKNGQGHLWRRER
jgi:hypothetical protein